MHYYPELGQLPNPDKIFRTNVVIGRTYSLRWPACRDAQAREILKQLKVRPARIQLSRVGIELVDTAKEDRYDCCITYAAWKKLNAADAIAHEVLLD
jgi:hypothetical protein